MLLGLKETAVTQDHRGPEVFRAQLVFLEKPEKGAVTGRMELVGCREKEVQRVTAGSTASQDCQGRKAIEVNSGPQVLQDLPEKMGQGEKTDRSDKEV